MPTVCASSCSQLPDAAGASTDAVTQALQRIAPHAPSVGLLFVSPEHDLVEVVKAAKQLAPSARFIASHTGGGLEGAALHRKAVVCLLISSDRARFEVRAAGVEPATPTLAAQSLCAGFKDAYTASSQRGLPYSTTALWLQPGSLGEQVLKELRVHTRPFQQVVGGVASDQGVFRSPRVMVDGEAGPTAGAALHIFDSVNWGVGVEHGLTRVGNARVVTKASGTRLTQLDGAPAKDAWAQTDPGFLLKHPLGVLLFDQVTHVRAPFAVSKAGDVRLVGSLAEGAVVSVLEGDVENVVAAAGRAAREARANLKGAEAAAVLVFDCFCRDILLGDAFPRAIDAIREVFPTEPLAGLVTFGEIARFGGRLDGWHNATVVVAAIPR